MSANGLLAGLVGITAPCAFVTAPVAVLIGAIAGVLCILSVFFVERVLKIDDPGRRRLGPRRQRCLGRPRPGSLCRRQVRRRLERRQGYRDRPLLRRFRPVRRPVHRHPDQHRLRLRSSPGSSSRCWIWLSVCGSQGSGTGRSRPARSRGLAYPDFNLRSSSDDTEPSHPAGYP